MIAPTITAAANIHLNTSFSFIVITYYILIFDIGANLYEYLPDAQDSRLGITIPVLIRVFVYLNSYHNSIIFSYFFSNNKQYHYTYE